MRTSIYSPSISVLICLTLLIFFSPKGRPYSGASLPLNADLVELLPEEGSSTPSPEEKLKAVYGDERVKEMKERGSGMYEYLLFKVEHSYKLIDAREGKSYREVSEIPYYAKKREKKKTLSASKLLQKVKNGSFNPLKCQLEKRKSSNSLYELKGTGKVLVLLSEDRITKKYKQAR